MGAPARHWIIRILVTLAVIAAAGFVLSLDIALWLRVASIAAGAAVALPIAFRFVPAFDPRARIRWRLPEPARSRHCIAVTFDDGPSPSTGAALDILAAEGVPATFFVLGRNAERHPDIVRRMQADGHAVGIHGLDHTRLPTADQSAVGRQVDGVIAVLTRIGVAPAPVYRTPHGHKSGGVFAAARRRGLTVWAWSRGIWDTDRPVSDVLVRRATRLARPGMVLLLHDGRGDEPQPDVTSMLQALPAILQQLKRRGFTFVRLTDV